MEIVRTLAVASTTPDRPEGVATAATYAGQDAPFQFAQMLGLLRRKIWLILLTGLLGAALAYTAASVFKKFTAEALILVEPPPNSGNQQAGMLSSDEQVAIETHVMALGSYAHLAKVLASFAQGEPATEGTFTLRNLQRNLKAQQGLRSRVISITFSDRDPVVAAAVANRSVELYVREQQNRTREEVTQLLARMQARVAAVKADIEATAASGGPVSGDADQQRRLRESLILVGGLQRQKEIIDRDGAPLRGIGFLSPAVVPDRPSTGAPPILAVPAFVAFAILGFFVALVIERSDRSLRSDQDIEQALGIPCFGLTPRMRRAADPRALQRRLARPEGAYGEALKALLFEQVLGADDLPKVVLVTSALAREGKSSLALGLAGCAAQFNRRVLLIDLDWRAQMRRRSRRRQAPPAGVLDMLNPIFPQAGAIAPIPELAFDRLGIGRLTRDPSAAIAGKPFAELVDRLRASYDLVVIDGPHLLGAAEASALVSLADKVLLAVRWGRTRREFTQRALSNLLGLHPLRFLGADRLGAVLTCVRLRRHALYRFGDRGEVLSRL
jgi:succinoglycan biosynthesis transport protein ExoP